MRPYMESIAINFMYNGINHARGHDTADIGPRSIYRNLRHGWEWDDNRMPRAAERLDRWREAGPGDGGLDGVRAALDDDLDTPAAVATVDRAVEGGKGVGAAAELLGIDLDL